MRLLRTQRGLWIWDPVPSGDDQAESDLVEKCLDLYELTSYYQVEEAFLSFKMLEAFASKITNDMLCEWHSHIGDNVSDELLPEMVFSSLGSGLGGSTATLTEISHQIAQKNTRLQKRWSKKQVE